MLIKLDDAIKLVEELPIGGGTLSSWINANESPMGATRRHIAEALRALPVSDGVTDEMVERAARAMTAKAAIDASAPPATEKEIADLMPYMRAALEAALGPLPAPPTIE